MSVNQTSVPYADCTEEFLRRQALFSELFKHSLTIPPQQRLDAARAILPAIEKLHDRIRAKLVAGLGDAEADRVIDILRNEGILFQHLINVIHNPDKKEGLPQLRKVAVELRENASKLLKSYNEFAQALMDYDTALYKQISDQLEGMDYPAATSKSNESAIKLAAAANKISGKRAAITSAPLMGVNSPYRTTTVSNVNQPMSYVPSGNSGNGNGTGWTYPTNTSSNANMNAVIPPQQVVVPPKKSTWNRKLMWLLGLVVLLGLAYYLFSKKKSPPATYGYQNTSLGSTSGMTPSSYLTFNQPSDVDNYQAGQTTGLIPSLRSDYYINPAAKASILNDVGDVQTSFIDPRQLNYGQL